MFLPQFFSQWINQLLHLHFLPEVPIMFLTVSIIFIYLCVCNYLLLFLILIKYFYSYRATAYFGETVFLVFAYIPFCFTYKTNFIIKAHKYFATYMLLIIKACKLFFAARGFFNCFFVYF